MADGVLKDVYPYSRQLLLNKLFDPSTPSMRIGRNGEKRETPTAGTPHARANYQQDHLYNNKYAGANTFRKCEQCINTGK